MPELIERGYIYIAQPPLYRVQKGKQVRYAKDDQALEEYLTQIALDDAALYANPHAPAISGANLAKIIDQYRLEMSTILRLSRRYPAAILESMIYAPEIKANNLHDQQFMLQWIATLQNLVETKYQSEGIIYKIGLSHETEHEVYLPSVSVLAHGVENTYKFSADFFATIEYQGLVALGQVINGLLEPGAYVIRADKKQNVTEFSQVIEWLMSEAKKGQMIQRYKGLGEMNPEQLWETTMDPAVRRMLRVKVEDAVAADGIFTTLMGDNVESRRDFIEHNAMQVGNLDI